MQKILQTLKANAKTYHLNQAFTVKDLFISSFSQSQWDQLSISNRQQLGTKFNNLIMDTNAGGYFQRIKNTEKSQAQYERIK